VVDQNLAEENQLMGKMSDHVITQQEQEDDTAMVSTKEYGEFLDAAKQDVAVSVLQRCFDLDDSIGMYIQRSDFGYLGMPEVPDEDTPTVPGEIRSEEALTDALCADLNAWAADGAPIPIALALDELTHAEHIARRDARRPPVDLPVGTRVWITASVERYPHGVVDAGALGTVTTTADTKGGLEGVTLDNPPDWLSEWDGELQWCDGIDSGPMASQVEKFDPETL
jgi:hypothetical protein